MDDQSAATRDAPRPLHVQGRRAAARPDRGGRAGRRHRQAVRDGSHVIRLDLEGSARDARDRDEPHRRQVEHRRGRRGRRPLHARRERRPAALGDQAGGLGSLRRDERVPRECRRPADQDGARSQAGGGRAAPGSQGVPVDREHPVLDAGRRPHLPAAAPRHLFDRGSQAADPRPEEREPAGARPREARRRGRGRHGRRRSVEGACRRRADLGPRRRHRCEPAHLAEARRRPVGARPRRDAADPAREPPARSHRRTGRRSAEDRPRRRDRARCSGRRSSASPPRRSWCRAA